MTENTRPLTPREQLLIKTVSLEKSGLVYLEKFIKKNIWSGDTNNFNPNKVELDVLETAWHALGNWLGNNQGKKPKLTKTYQGYFGKLTTFLQTEGILGENPVEEQAEFLAWVQGGALIPIDFFKR